MVRSHAELRDRALALILKARLPQGGSHLLALLDGERRSRIETFIAEASADPEAELRNLRAEELKRAELESAAQLGAVWKELSPALRFWAWRV